LALIRHSRQVPPPGARPPGHMRCPHGSNHSGSSTSQLITMGSPTADNLMFWGFLHIPAVGDGEDLFVTRGRWRVYHLRSWSNAPVMRPAADGCLCVLNLGARILRNAGGSLERPKNLETVFTQRSRKILPAALSAGRHIYLTHRLAAIGGRPCDQHLALDAACSASRKPDATGKPHVAGTGHHEGRR
jgi:hypothetical protein